MTSPLSQHSANGPSALSQHSANGRVQPARIPLPNNLGLLGTGMAVTTESILRSRISELEAQVENLKAQLKK